MLPFLQNTSKEQINPRIGKDAPCLFAIVRLLEGAACWRDTMGRMDQWPSMWCLVFLWIT